MLLKQLVRTTLKMEPKEFSFHYYFLLAHVAKFKRARRVVRQNGGIKRLVSIIIISVQDNNNEK